MRRSHYAELYFASLFSPLPRPRMFSSPLMPLDAAMLLRHAPRCCHLHAPLRLRRRFAAVMPL